MRLVKFGGLFLVSACIWGCGSNSQSEATPSAEVVVAPPMEAVNTDPIFPNSIVSNSLSFIELTDASVTHCMVLTGRETREMPGGPTNNLFEDNVYIFEANYADGTTVEVWATARFSSESAAESEAGEIAMRLALLPTFMRETLNHVILHTGDSTAFAEDLAHFFVVYEENMAFRRSENDMEETLFHESVHATMDNMYRDGDPRWANAQQTDPGFITEFARDRVTEDLAESAIFAFTDKYFPGRLPEDVTNSINLIMPNRLDFLQSIFPEEATYFEDIRAAKGCTQSPQ